MDNQSNQDVNDILPPTTVNCLTEEELERMPIGACVIDTDMDVLVCVGTYPSRVWASSGCVRFESWQVASFRVIPLHLSVEELDNLPTGTTVVDEDGIEWPIKGGQHSYSMALARRRIDRRTVAPPWPKSTDESDPMDTSSDISPVYPPAGTLVLVRASAAGVHFGYLADVDPTAVRLIGSRRLYSWSGEAAYTLSEVASGVPLTSSRIGASIDLTVGEWCELIPLTEQVRDRLLAVNTWEPAQS